MAEICSEDSALIWSVDSDATSSVVHAATAAVESDLIWGTLSEEMVVVMYGALTLDQMPKTKPRKAFPGGEHCKKGKSSHPHSPETASYNRLSCR